MKIAVLGAKGRTGIVLVKELLSRGHEVHGLGFGGSPADHPKFKWFSGDATNRLDVLACIQGVDVVISTLGHTRKTKTPIQTQCMIILTELLKGKKTRIISMTGTGVREPGDSPSLLDKVLTLLIKVIDPKRVDDGIDHAKVLKDSDKDFTILRLLKLGKGNKKQPYRLTPGGPAMNLTNRWTVAEILADLAESEQWSKQMPVVSSKLA